MSTGSLLKLERRKGRGSTRSRHGMKGCVAAMCGRRCEHSSLLKLERREGRPARNSSKHEALFAERGSTYDYGGGGGEHCEPDQS